MQEGGEGGTEAREREREGRIPRNLQRSGTRAPQSQKVKRDGGESQGQGIDGGGGKGTMGGGG